MVDTSNFPDLPTGCPCVLLEESGEWALAFVVRRPSATLGELLAAAWRLAKTRPGRKAVVALQDTSGKIRVWKEAEEMHEEDPGVPEPSEETPFPPEKVEHLALQLLPAALSYMPPVLAVPEAFSLAESFLTETAKRGYARTSKDAERVAELEDCLRRLLGQARLKFTREEIEELYNLLAKGTTT